MSSDASFFGDGSQAIQSTITADVNLHRSCSIVEFYELHRCVEWLNSHSDINRVSIFHNICVGLH